MVGPLVTGSQDFRAVVSRGSHQVGALMRRRVEWAWRLRWFLILSCAVARAFVVFLLELRGGHGVDGHTLPDHEVERD